MSVSPAWAKRCSYCSRVRYYHADLLGSIRLITDAAGDVIQAYDYTSFGETTECLFPFPFQPFQYAAREDDPDSKLDYNRARYYNPRAGRFISPDPLGAAGGRTNRFLYVGNSPTRFKDPSGRRYQDFVDVVQYMRQVEGIRFCAGIDFGNTDPSNALEIDPYGWTNPATGHVTISSAHFSGDLLVQE